MEREGVGWWIFLGFDLKSGCRDSGRFLMLVLDWILMLDLKSGCRDSGLWILMLDLKSGCRDSGLWILMLDLKSGCRDSGLWILNVGSEEWGQIDPKSGWILGDFRM